MRLKKRLIIMKKPKFQILSTCILLLAVALPLLMAACSPRQTAQPTLTLTPQPTRTRPQPTTTLTFTPTVMATPSASPTATPTITPAPLMDFTQARIVAAGILSGWRCLITIQFLQSVQGEYSAVVDENKDYTCELISIYPNRIYCYGPLSALNDDVHFQLYQKGLDYPVMDLMIRMPAQP
jgi:hypothetical protein